MNVPAPEEPPIKPWWASLWFWLLAAVFAATMSFAWMQRAALLRAYRLYMPGMTATGKSLLKNAKDYTGQPAMDEDDGLPGQPSAVRLSAPVDPSRGFAKTDARVRTSSKGRRIMRDVSGRGKSGAGEVQEVRQFMNAYEVSHEKELGFWQSDEGIGIQISLSISFFFFCVGYVLFQHRPRSTRKL
ncbi:MAG: hypothetical protein ABIJ96_16115 [Elusimicrobiota bacterium]